MFTVKVYFTTVSRWLVINNRQFSVVNGKPTRVLSINNTFLMEKVYL